MPIVSKYNQQQLDHLLDDILTVFESQQIPAELALMALGNAVSNVVEQGYPEEKRAAVAKQFSNILLQSLGNHH
ncbi:DUF1414 domain-containing protein [Idiomarina xiamenensis]|uniref:Uncharacterized protein n=1 Tax=Idiomarina xiamenensis 10-D-4 TaxID=740709 RepID=K2JWE9_9GAMM|nr:DUF1414 domain-containing protein [Idiomarina xiamenensis]EKE79833.1 hypothetical protein A10D4_12542 [Idiomarina xiamenensis 10-D-4]